MTKQAYAILTKENGRYIARYFQTSALANSRELRHCKMIGIETKTVRCDHTMAALRSAVDNANIDQILDRTSYEG